MPPVRTSTRQPTVFAPPYPTPSPSGPPVCRWPITGTITGHKIFNWLDVRLLCYLTEKQVEDYEQDYWMVTTAIEPVMRDPTFKSKRDWKWDKIFAAFSERNFEWSTLNKPRSLSTDYDRYRKTLNECIAAHNSRVEHESLASRTAQTLKFLQLPRDPVDNQPDQRRVPLVPCRIQLYDPNTEPANVPAFPARYKAPPPRPVIRNDEEYREYENGKREVEKADKMAAFLKQLDDEEENERLEWLKEKERRKAAGLPIQENEEESEPKDEDSDSHQASDNEAREDNASDDDVGDDDIATMI